MNNSADSRPDWPNHNFLDNIARMNINGCDIKNVVHVAHALAAHAGRELEGRDVESTLDTRTAFDVDFRDQLGRTADNIADEDRPVKRRKTLGSSISTTEQ